MPLSLWGKTFLFTRISAENKHMSPGLETNSISCRNSFYLDDIFDCKSNMVFYGSTFLIIIQPIGQFVLKFEMSV